MRFDARGRVGVAHQPPAILMLGWMGARTLRRRAASRTSRVGDNPAVMLALAACIWSGFVRHDPGVDTARDALRTFIHIPAGALLAARRHRGLDGRTIR